DSPPDKTGDESQDAGDDSEAHRHRDLEHGQPPGEHYTGGGRANLLPGMGAGLQGDKGLQGGQQGGDPRDGGGGEEEGREDEEEGAAPVREAQGDGGKNPQAETTAGQPLRDSQLGRGNDGRGLREHREVRRGREGGRGGDGQADKPLPATRG